jgi:preprotein translocase YajC subunit
MRPQQQRMRKQRELLGSLEIGDTIATAGGMVGRIVELTDERAVIEVGDGVHIEFLRAAISRKVEESTSAYYHSADYEYDTDYDATEDGDGLHDEAEATDQHQTEDHQHTTEGPDTPEQEKQ